MTELIFTVGRASGADLEKHVQTGATMARLTFSYGTNETQLRRALELRRLAEKNAKKLEICGELEGQRLRIGKISKDGIEDDILVEKGRKYLFLDVNAVDKRRTTDCIPIPSLLAQGLKENDRIVYGDTGSEFEVTCISDDGIAAIALNSDVIVGTRSVLIADRPLPAFRFDEKSKSQAEYILASEPFDFLVVPSVLDHEILLEAREMIKASGRKVGLISKLGFPIKLSNLSRICDISEFVILDRADCALAHGEVSMPGVVEGIISSFPHVASKLIISSQIASSMGRSDSRKLAYPEISDIWNFVDLGIAGFMLAEETAVDTNGVQALVQVSTLISTYSNTAS